MLQSSDAWPLVRWVLGAQLILSALAMLVTLLVSTAINSVFVGLGGLLAIFVSAVFALRMFRIDARENPEQALRLFYRAAMYKLVMAVLAFLVIGKTMPERVMPVLIGFGAATLSYWFALLSKR